MTDTTNSKTMWAQPEDLVGVVLDGRYRVVALLGAGGMGAVYEGEQITLRKRVAIKVLRPQLASDEAHVQRFLREARAASMIHHRNVVDIVDFGQVPGGTVYFVMEFLDGRDLSRLIRSEGSMPWSRVRGILLQVVAALKAAHKCGIVHRDVKPANCYLLQLPEEGISDLVKVLDFGIAKLAEANEETPALTRADELMGTAAYMAPEQALGHAVDPRTDIYSLGVMLYQMLTGRVPFPGTNSFQVLTQHVNEPPPSPREVNPEVTPAVESLVLRMLAKLPENRYQDMSEVEAAVLAIDGAGVVGVGPSSGVPRPVGAPRSGASATWARPKAEETDPTQLLPLSDDPDSVPPRTMITPASGPSLAGGYGASDSSTTGFPTTDEGANRVVRPSEVRLAGTVDAPMAPVDVEPGLLSDTGTPIADPDWPPKRRGGFALMAIAGLAVVLAGAVSLGRYLVAEQPVRPIPATTIALGAQDAEPREPDPPVPGVAQEQDGRESEEPTPVLVDPPEAESNVETIIVETPEDDAGADSVPTNVAPVPDVASSAKPAKKKTRRKSRKRRSKAKAKAPSPAVSEPPPALTDNTVRAALRREVLKSCPKGAAGGKVHVGFQISTRGRVLLAKVSPPNHTNAVGRCALGVVKKAQFPEGRLRHASVTVSL